MMKYGLSAEQLTEIKTVVAGYPEIQKVILYGSRAMGNYKAASDVDLAIIGDNLPFGFCTTIKAHFEEETYLPFFFDILDYQTLTNEKLKKHIDERGVVVYQQGQEEWVECMLGDVITLQRGFDLPKRQRKHGDNPIIVSNGIDGTNIDYKVKAPGVVTGRSGTLGKVFFIKNNFWPLNTTLWVKNFFGNYPNFIYYFLKTLTLENYNSGSGVPTLNRNHICSLAVKIPPLPEQQAIAEVLSSLDDKIDLLHRQNKTLEDMAQTLFRQWFIEEAQDDWEDVLITTLFEVKDGTHESPKVSRVGKTLITTKHISNNGLDIQNSYLISEEDFKKINKRSEVTPYDILFSMIGTIGLLYFEQAEKINYAIKNIGLFKTSQNQDYMYFTYLWLKSIHGYEFIQHNRSGSTQEYISLKSLRSIVFYLPDQMHVRAFNKKVKFIFKKIYKNQTQIQTLEKLRDTLLPKLISGEVRVRF